MDEIHGSMDKQIAERCRDQWMDMDEMGALING